MANNLLFCYFCVQFSN